MNVTFLADTTFSLAFRLKDDQAWLEGLEWVSENIEINGDSIDVIRTDGIGYTTLVGDITATVVENEVGYRYVIVSKQNVGIDTINTDTFTITVGNNTYYLSLLNYFASAEAAAERDPSYNTLRDLTRTLYAYANEAYNLTH